jgi:hypothetical protein
VIQRIVRGLHFHHVGLALGTAHVEVIHDEFVDWARISTDDRAKVRALVLRVGSRLGAYEITGHIGAGSMPTGSPPRTQPQPPAHSRFIFPFPDRATTWSLEPEACRRERR